MLIDEISRCKPEHQNRLFSLWHERRIQGIALTSLRFRWAAMNPAATDQSDLESYTGSEPLDPALADRFSLFVRAVDWDDLSEDERNCVTSPAGEGSTGIPRGSMKARAGWSCAGRVRCGVSPKSTSRSGGCCRASAASASTAGGGSVQARGGPS